MSVRLLTQAYDANLPLAEKSILLYLAFATNDDGRGCWPAVATICEKTGTSESTVHRVLGKLEKRGCLSRQFRKGRATVIFLHPEHWPMPSKGGATVTPLHPHRGVTVTGEGCRSDTQNRKRTKKVKGFPLAGRNGLSTEVDSSRYAVGSRKPVFVEEGGW